MEGAADTSGDGVVTADELAEYVHTQVREYTANRQNPTSDKANYDPEMLLAYIPSKAKPAAAPAAKFGALVFESNMDGVEVFVDGKTIGVLEKGKPVSAPGLPPGEHTVQGVKMGYEPDGPRQEMVYPGQESPVRIRILIPRRRNKAAVDLLQEGIKYYLKGNEQDYKKAVAFFERALAADPTYSQAAFYLGRTYSALFDYDNAGRYYKQAIQLDPDYLEAHANYGGILLDTGDVDEAVRQLNTVLQREPANSRRPHPASPRPIASRRSIRNPSMPPAKPSRSTPRPPNRTSGWPTACASAVSSPKPARSTTSTSSSAISTVS